MSRVRTAGEREKRFADDIWLNYFNRYLLEKGVISERDYNVMTAKIAARKPARIPSQSAR